MADVKLPNAPTENEISDFLSRVDEIDNVLKGLNNADEQNVAEYMSKADNLIKDTEERKKEVVFGEQDDKDLPITRTGFSKTSINRDAYKNDSNQGLTGPALPVEGPVDQKAFMAAMEADAAERAERKKKQEKISNEFKQLGNVEFRQGNFQKALEFYDKAYEQKKDNTAVYTNRAQTRIKLGMYKEALTDCDWALRLWPNCLKALVQQGHAYLHLKEFDNARESYRQISAIDNRKESLVMEYLDAVDREEQAILEEQKATALFDEGNETAQGVVAILNRLNKEGQLSIYYSGGFRALTQLLINTDAQTLFRTNQGLLFPQAHHELKRCLTVHGISSLSTADRDLVSTALNMLKAACEDNETSQQQLLSIQKFPCQLLSILEAQFNGQGRILKSSCVNLLHTISCTQAGRAAMVAQFDLTRLTSSLFMLMTKNSSYAEPAAALLNNIALDKRLKTSIRDSIEERILPAFESLLISNKTSPAIIALACSTFTNLATDIKIRNKMSGRASLWMALAQVLPSKIEGQLCSCLESILGLLVNISTGLVSLPTFTESTTTTTTTVPTPIHESLTMIVMSQDESWLTSEALTRCLVVLSNILPHSQQAAAWMSIKERVLRLMELLQDEQTSTKKPALKCLTSLTQNEDSVREIVTDNKGTSLLLKLLTHEKKTDSSPRSPDTEPKSSSSTSNSITPRNTDHEIIVGNAILCLSHLTSRPKFCGKLAKTNIVQNLLVLARDGHSPALQSNAAILIAKLVKGDSRHLERLRELHGIEILHGCMKHIK